MSTVRCVWFDQPAEFRAKFPDAVALHSPETPLVPPPIPPKCSPPVFRWFVAQDGRIPP